MASIKSAIQAVKARPKKRAAVRVPNQAAAAQVKKTWMIEDAIRDTHAKVMSLAEHVDHVRAIAERARSGKRPVIEGMDNATWTFDPETDHWFGIKIEPGTPDSERPCMAQYNALAAEAYQEFYHAVYSARAAHAQRRAALTERNTFHPANESHEYLAAVRGKSRDALLALIDSECEAVIESASALYGARMDGAYALLKAQEAAMARFDALPTAEEYQGFLVVHEDGTITWSLRP